MADEQDTITINTKTLDDLMAAFRGKLPVARVGIIGSKSPARKGALTNANIGYKHEFGDPSNNLPMRSFLRVPITEKLEKYLAQYGAFKDTAIKQIIKEKSIVSFMKDLGLTAEQIVIDAFSSNGFGQWAPWSGNYKSKTGDILVDTQQLRNSITSDVEE